MSENENEKLVNDLKGVLIKLIGTQNLFRNGQWWHADRKLQGVRDMLSQIIVRIAGESVESVDIAKGLEAEENGEV
jgi:hypothetical protein